MRSNFINTASYLTVNVPTEPNQFLLNLHTGRSLTKNTTPDAELIKFDLVTMSTEFARNM